MDLLLVSALPEDTGPLIGCRLSPRGRDDRGLRDALGGRIDGRRGFRFARRAGERRHVIVQAARVRKTGCASVASNTKGPGPSSRSSARVNPRSAFEFAGK